MTCWSFSQSTLALYSDPNYWINETLDIEVLTKIRRCANTGLTLGTEAFREQVRNLRS